ncbi:MAG: FIST C-terminal domain-containing protein [Pseudomonadota bacterium]
MKIDVLSQSGATATQDLAKDIQALAETPHFIAVMMNCDLDVTPLVDVSKGTSLIGATSALGAMSDAGACDGAVAFCITDAEGDYGVGYAPLSDSPNTAAAKATKDALSAADRPGERPSLVWVMATPGCEEEVLAGIQSVIGSDTPIVGGSAADNTVEGNWFAFADTKEDGATVAVATLFPSGRVQHAYQNGYAPSETVGLVTRVSGRTVHEIDHRPAAEVYHDWTGHAVPGVEEGQTEPRAILGESTFWPLGRSIAPLNGVPQFLLAHPSAVNPDGSIELFANVFEGEKLHLMSGRVDGLVSRAGRVAALAKDARSAPTDAIVGALMVYCGGCMFAVRDRIEDVVGGVQEALPNVPFAGFFSFGEQGPVVEEGNRHGNLMISCLVFTQDG